MKILGLISKKEKKENNENNENVKMIPVPDIREYMLKGYEEIREVKKQKEKLEESEKKYKDNAEKFEKLYDATLVSLREFERRDKDNQIEIKRWKDRYESECECRKADNKGNKETIEKLKEEKYILEEELKGAENIISTDLKNRITNEIIRQKGNLSKDKIIKIIKDIK